MGEAIARFRQAALIIRRECDAYFYSTPVGTQTQHEWFAHLASDHAESMEHGYLSVIEYCEEMTQVRSIIEAELEEAEEARELLDDLPLFDREELQEVAELYGVTLPKLRAMARARSLKSPEDPLLPPPARLRPSPELRQLAKRAVVDGTAWSVMAATAEAHILSLARMTEAIQREVSHQRDSIRDAWEGVGLEPLDPSSYYLRVVPELLSYAAEGQEERDEKYAAVMQQWLDAYLALSPFEESPTQALPHAPATVPQAASTRARGGGRTRIHDGSLLAARHAYEVSMRKKNRKPEGKKVWLIEWARGHGLTRAEVERRWKAELRQQSRKKKR